MGTLGGIEAAFLMAAALTGVDADLLSSLCYVESHHNTSAYLAQDGGSASLGICQVKLSTARALGYVGRADRLMELETNALYASKYLAKQKKRYGTWEKAVSAYNCGHACNNRRYVKKVMD